MERHPEHGNRVWLAAHSLTCTLLHKSPATKKILGTKVTFHQFDQIVLSDCLRSICRADQHFGICVCSRFAANYNFRCKNLFSEHFSPVLWASCQLEKCTEASSSNSLKSFASVLLRVSETRTCPRLRSCKKTILLYCLSIQNLEVRAKILSSVSIDFWSSGSDLKSGMKMRNQYGMMDPEQRRLV